MRRDGFTLLELVVVVGIFGFVMSMAYTILDTTLKAERRVTRNTRTGKVGDGILTLMRRDLQGAIWRGLGSEVFRGIDGGAGDAAEDEVHFLTTAEVPSPDDDPEWSGSVAAVGYVLRPGEDGLKTLFRRVKWDLSYAPLDDGEYFEIYTRVQGMEIRYLDREREWREEWDSIPELEVLLNENRGTFTPFADERRAAEEEAALDDDLADEVDPPIGAPIDGEEEPEAIPLPIPRAVEIVLYIAVGDERELYTGDDGERLIERVSTIVPLLSAEILRVEDPTALDDEDPLIGG